MLLRRFDGDVLYSTNLNNVIIANSCATNIRPIFLRFMSLS